MSTVVNFENLWCVFEHRSGQLVHALEDVNFRVDPGEFVCVVDTDRHRGDQPEDDAGQHLAMASCARTIFLSSSPKGLLGRS